MTSAAAWNEAAFAERLKAEALALPPGLTSWNGAEPARRFAVYRNNVRGALVEAIAVRYPVVQRLVGEEFFRVMARQFALANLPASPVLIGYGEAFPDFIAGFEAAASLPYLPDVARLESAYWRCYHAADDEPVAPTVFQNIHPESLAALRFQFLAASAVVASAHPIVSIWQTNAADAEVKPVDLAQAEDALISRPGLSVEVRILPPGAACFIASLMADATLAEAADQAASAAQDFDLARNIGGLIQARIIRAVIS
jgi:hypothetical protein